MWDGWFTLLVTTELPNLPVNTGGEGGCGMDGSLCWSLLNYQIYLLILVGGLWDGWFTLLVTTELPNLQLPVNTGGGFVGWMVTLLVTTELSNLQLPVNTGGGFVGWMVHFTGHFAGHY